jgi:hypothetical protein
MNRRLAVIPAVAILAAGCGSTHNAAPTTGPATSSSTSTTTAPTPHAAPTAVTVFRLRDGVLRAETERVPHTTAVARAALAALGVDAPVTIGAGTAAVALDSAPAGEVAEIVYTLTQYPTVQHVDVAGRKGLTRSDVISYAPPILVESPARDMTEPQEILVRGSASVFEATLVVELRRGDQVVEKHSVTASEGAPGRGDFTAILRAPSPGAYTVAAYAPSAADGTAQHEQDIPITVTP